jgi:ubiquinone/menaquinone biosynthesis C-methylase UbiE
MTSPEVVSSYAAVNRAELVDFILAQLHKALINGNQINTIVDVCCGCGDLTVGLAKRFSSSTVLGVDGSDEMLQVAEGKLRNSGVANLSFVKKNINEDNIGDAGFDLVISSMALHHFEDIDGTLNILKGLASPGGYVVVFDMLREENQEKAEELINRITQVYFDSSNSASSVPFKESFANSLNACLSFEELKNAVNSVFGDQEIKVFTNYKNGTPHPCDGLGTALVCAQV